MKKPRVHACTAHTVQALGRSCSFEQDLCLGDMRLHIYSNCWMYLYKLQNCQIYLSNSHSFDQDLYLRLRCVRGNELLVGLRGWTQKVKSGRTSFLIVGRQKSRKLDLLRMTRVCSSYIFFLISSYIGPNLLSLSSDVVSLLSPSIAWF